MDISKFAVFAAILFSVCVTLASTSGAGKSIVVTNADNGKQISLPVGGSLDIQLQQAGATGYVWEIVSLDKSHLELLTSDTVIPPNDKPLVGGPVMRKWSMRAVAKGRTEVMAALYRPWEGEEKAAEKFTLKVNIQ